MAFEDIEFEKIIGSSQSSTPDSGSDARQKIDRNFEKVNREFVNLVPNIQKQLFNSSAESSGYSVSLKGFINKTGGTTNFNDLKHSEQFAYDGGDIFVNTVSNKDCPYIVFYNAGTIIGFLFVDANILTEVHEIVSSTKIPSGTTHYVINGYDKVSYAIPYTQKSLRDRLYQQQIEKTLDNQLGYFYDSVGGEALAGGLLSTNMVTVPTGQTGNASYMFGEFSNKVIINEFKKEYTEDEKSISAVVKIKISDVELASKLRTFITLVPQYSGAGTTIYRYTSGNYIYALMHLTKDIKDIDALRIGVQFDNTEPLSKELTFEFASATFAIDNVSMSQNKVAKTAITENRSFTVKKVGGDFDNPIIACNAIRKMNIANKENPIDVFIHEGDYDIRAAWTQEDISGSYIHGSQVGWNLPDHVHLKGVGNRNKIICRCENTDTESAVIVEKSSTINLRYNNTIENITFIGKNTRYTVHDESSGAFKDFIRRVRNCRFVHLGNKEGFWEWDCAWGAGSSSGAYIEVLDSVFESPRMAYSCHNNKNFELPSHHRIVNCDFITTGNTWYALEFTSLGSGVKDKVELIGNRVSSAIHFGQLTLGIGCDYDLSGYGNTQVPIFIEQNTDNQYVYNLADECMQVKNIGTSTIWKAKAVKIDLKGYVTTMQVGDPITLFAGIAFQDIEANGMGIVKYKGYLKLSDLGLTASLGDKIGIVESGKLSVITEGDYIGVVNIEGWIKIL